MLKKSQIKLLSVAAGIVSVCFLPQLAFAKEATSLAGIAENVQGQISAFGNLLISIAYLAGIGFSMGAIFKFKQHKDNPTQVPIGQPFGMLAVGVLLVFLPGIFKPAAKSIFGTTSMGDAMTGTFQTGAIKSGKAT
jgi:intracellular multiplication protein IcmD